MTTETPLERAYRLGEGCGGLDPAGVKQLVEMSRENERLAGRVARCFCGAERPSSPSLPFFEFCGDGSDSAAHCVCGYAECAHDPDYMETLVHGRDGKRRPTVVESGRCDGFKPRGDRGHDRFYCGCRGWD